LIFNVETKLRKEFLSAYITGNGTLAYRPKRSDCFVRIVTTSDFIKTQLSYILLENDINFSIRRHYCDSILPTGHRSKLPQWWITFGGKKNLQKFLGMAKFLDSRTEKIRYFIKRTRNQKEMENPETIKEIKDVSPKHEFVYDLALEGNDNDWQEHSFFAADGLLIHNCQNWNISQFPERGDVMDGAEIAAWLDFRAGIGRIINANFVGGDPTPNLHTILDTLKNTKADIPMIWNSNMFMSEETVRLLDGAMDAYLADFRYGNDESAMKLSKAPRYMETITRNFKAIEGRAGLIVRILVLPNHVVSDAIPIIDWLSENMPESIYVNLMSQYFPQYKAREMEGLDRPLKKNEFSLAAERLKKSKIRYYEIQ
jgi:pyruvate-formate lyase-activating enzyme